MIPTSKLEAVLATDTLSALSNDSSTETPDEDILRAALDAAECEVRFAIAAAGHALPEVLPAMLVDAAVTLAVGRLFDRRREIDSGPWRERSRDARLFLSRIARRELMIPELASASKRLLHNHEHEPVTPSPRLFESY